MKVGKLFQLLRDCVLRKESVVGISLEYLVSLQFLRAS